MKYMLLSLLIASALSGCGGGGDSGSSVDDTDDNTSTSEEVAYYTAVSTTTDGGSLSPSRESIQLGDSFSFLIEPESGYALESITGCAGRLDELTYTISAMAADCSITPVFIGNAENAIKNEDHQLASALELITYSAGIIDMAEENRKTIVNTLYQGIEDDISWDPSHDSITFTSFMPENSFTVLPVNVDEDGDDASGGLIMAGEQEELRYAAMAANLFSVDTSTGTDALLKNLLSWLTEGNDINDGFNIVTAQMPSNSDSWYFPHNEDIRTWLATHYTDAHTINTANACDYSELNTCIETYSPDLIILSDIDREDLGYEGISDAVESAKAAGIPLLLSNYKRTASDMLSPLYSDMGLSASGNYWSQRQASEITIDSIKAQDSTFTGINELLDNLATESFDTSILDDCGQYFSCTETEFLDEFKTGADWYRNNASSIDGYGINVFESENFSLIKSGLLLADKYRADIDYPIAYTSHVAWQKAMFADWLVSYARHNNIAQPDLGEYVTDKSNLTNGENANYTHPDSITERKTISVPYSGQWTTTTWYALPGKTITITRHDETDASVNIKLNYHRTNTNRVYEQQIYRGPLELRQQRLSLEQGQSLNFSTPYGGPIYLYLTGDESPVSVDITIEGVVKHPSITDFSDDTQVSDFNEKLTNTDLPHIDLRTDNAELHLRRDRFTDAVGTESIPDVDSLLTSIVEDHINNAYTLAGLKIQGKTLSESLPTDVKTACTALFGDDCIDADLHTRKTIQHANYDQNAQCGSGCSGNPWDASWDVSPTGWGDNHELGHNLQTNRLNVRYAAAEDIDDWTGYSNRATENSNNIFPYTVKWKTHYLRDGNTSTITDGHMNHKDLFYVFMSDVAEIKNNSNERIVFDADCNVMDDGQDRYTAPWVSNDYAAHNGYRMAFYIQMALQAHGMTLSDGTTLENGFNIYTLLYQHSRIFGNYAANSTDWLANRTQLGFSQFPYEGDSIYGGNKINNITGNDFLLVSLSKITGKDWRNHFDLLGVRYTSLAEEQVDINATAGSVPMGMYELEEELPPANMSEGLTFISLSLTDGTTLWKSSTSPTQCEIP